MKFKIFYNILILFLAVGFFRCDSVEPKIVDPDFIIDGKIISAKLEQVNSNYQIRVSYSISFHFIGQPGFINQMKFLTEGFTYPLNLRQFTAYEVNKKYQQESGYWLPDSLNNFDSLNIYFTIDGKFEIKGKDSVNYKDFIFSDSVNVIVQK